MYNRTPISEVHKNFALQLERTEKQESCLHPCNRGLQRSEILHHYHPRNETDDKAATSGLYKVQDRQLGLVDR